MTAGWSTFCRTRGPFSYHLRCSTFSTAYTALATHPGHKRFVNLLSNKHTMRTSFIFLACIATITVVHVAGGSVERGQDSCSPEKVHKLRELQTTLSQKLASLRTALKKLEDLRRNKGWQNQVTSIRKKLCACCYFNLLICYKYIYVISTWYPS